MKILIALPVYNEEIVLRENILKLYNFLKENIKDDWQIVIADNGSTDKTPVIGRELTKFDPKKISYFYIPQRGRGEAIKKAWLDFEADFYTYMDCDLATDLAYFPLLIEEIKNGNEIVIGSRLMQTSDTKRSLLRESTSRIFNFLLRTILHFRIKDSQCGFKGATCEVVKKITPQVLNHEWFFDTEFLFLAQKNGYKIKEIPVRWTETPNPQRKSKVKVIKTSLNYLKEIWRLKKYDND